MQRYGPPPSYPSLKIPGLNSPIPVGGNWGFHPGGWGKPPCDEYGRPLFGDVFGVVPISEGGHAPILETDLDPELLIDKSLWGELEVEEEEEEEEEEDAEETEEVDDENGSRVALEFENGRVLETGLMTPGGLATPSGIASSVFNGLETPDHIELRKDARR